MASRSNGLAYALLWFLAALFPLTDADIWWHLASAQQMVAQGTWLHADPFTYTALGSAWTNVHWLYQLLIYSIYNICGPYGALGLVVFHALLWGAAAAAWTRRDQSLGLWALAVPLLWATHFLLLARPLALTLLLLGLQKRLFEREPLERKALAGILLLQIALANVQGLFLLGPLCLLFVGWVGHQANAKKYGIPLAMLCVSMVHPAGPRILLYPWELLWRLRPGNIFATRVSENVSPAHALLHPFAGSWSGFAETWAALALLILTGMILWALINKRSRLWILLLPMLFLAWLSLRNIPIILVVALPWLLSVELSSRGQRYFRKLGLAMLVALVLAQVQWWRMYPTAVAPFRNSEGALQWLKTQGSWTAQNPLRLFCETRQGGAVELADYPRVLTHIDGRLILRNADFFAKYLEIADSPAHFDAYAERYHIDAALLPVAYPPLLQGLASHLARSPGWSLAFVDETVWLFVRKPLLAKSLQGRAGVVDSIWADYGERSLHWSKPVAREGRHWLAYSLSIFTPADL